MHSPPQDDSPSGPGNKQPSKSRTVLGRRGEEIAAQHLQGLGYRIIERNWRSPHTRHEIDLIALDGQTVVFVEVKTARTPTFGDPLSWITPRKCKAIITAAKAFLAGWTETGNDFRFDAVTVGPPSADGKWNVHHLPSAFTGDDA